MHHCFVDNMIDRKFDVIIRLSLVPDNNPHSASASRQSEIVYA